MSSLESVRDGESGTESRVPLPDGGFWALKIVTTGMGETASDSLVRSFAPEVVVPAAFAVLVVALVLQLRRGRYRPPTYWGTALMVSVFGTMAADVLHVGLGVPYVVSSGFFALALATVFVVWWLVERDLSVHDVVILRREGFYWAAVLTTFALGTATGDLTAQTFGLGYLASGVLFAIAFAVPGLAFAATRRGAVALFWTAYVLTRPLGASFADWFAVPPARGGLGVGSGPVTLVLLGVFAVLLVVVSRREVARRRARAAVRGSAVREPVRA